VDAELRAVRDCGVADDWEGHTEAIGAVGALIDPTDPGTDRCPHPARPRRVDLSAGLIRFPPHVAHFVSPLVNIGVLAFA
jgi:hypothetical protein